jgi:hypothetical protein
MNLAELARTLNLENLAPAVRLSAAENVAAGYASDLLSDVLANAPRRGVLVTVQVHLNVVAVAVHADLAAVIFAAGRRPEPEVVARAAAEGVALLASDETAFDLVGRLYALGIRGRAE